MMMAAASSADADLSALLLGTAVAESAVAVAVMRDPISLAGRRIHAGCE